MREKVLLDVAGNDTVNLELDRFPIPEPAGADAINDTRNSQGPDDQVEGYVDTRVDGCANAVEEVEKKDYGVVDKDEDDLGMRQSGC